MTSGREVPQRKSQPTPLTLDQNGLVVLEVFLHALLVGERHRGPLGPTFDKLVMHQVFAHELDVETRILHPPDLSGFQQRSGDSTLLIHELQAGSVPEQARPGNANRIP